MSDSVVVPEPQYIGLQAESEGLPDVWIINQAMDKLEPKSAYSWHLSIIVECKEADGHGLPSKAEEAVLSKVSQAFDDNLTAGGNALVLARVTWNGTRQYVYRVRDPEIANAYLSELVKQTWLRPIDYEMREDAEWNDADDYLRHARGKV